MPARGRIITPRCRGSRVTPPIIAQPVVTHQGFAMPRNQAPVGIIGTGLMGTACARRLIAAGYAVSVYDVAPAKSAALAALGGNVAPSIAELAQHCGAVVIAVFNTEQVEAALEAPDGLLASRPAGPIGR